MGIIQEIEGLKKEHIKMLSDKFIKLCHNEYMRRWKLNNRDKVNSYQRDYYKKYHENTKKDKPEVSKNTMKINPLDIINTR